MIRSIAPPRLADAYGRGHFGASRGNRTHTGIDLRCAVGSEILAPCTGVVSRLGYAYSDDLSFQYVEIHSNDYHVRVFYIDPRVKVGDKCRKNERVIGVTQRLDERYPKDKNHIGPIDNHVHLAVRNSKGVYIDPAGVILS